MEVFDYDPSEKDYLDFPKRPWRGYVILRSDRPSAVTAAHTALAALRADMTSSDVDDGDDGSDSDDDETTEARLFWLDIKPRMPCSGGQDPH